MKLELHNIHVPNHLESVEIISAGLYRESLVKHVHTDGNKYLLLLITLKPDRGNSQQLIFRHVWRKDSCQWCVGKITKTRLKQEAKCYKYRSVTRSCISPWIPVNLNHHKSLDIYCILYNRSVDRPVNIDKFVSEIVKTYVCFHCQ